MKLNPFRKAPDKSREGGIAAALRAGQSLGPWTAAFAGWEPRANSPWLWESLREALPVLDGGINRLVTLDGILTVEGGNDALVQEIEEWMRNVPVNDLQTGYQAFYASQGDEHYEQGIGLGEMVYAANGRDVVGMRVADSKGIGFVRDGGRLRCYYRAPSNEPDRRPDGLGSVGQLLAGETRARYSATGLLEMGYVELDLARCVVALHRAEADNPYGTSLLRSLPFVAQILLKVQNATGRVWERWGDPSFHVHYGTKNRKVDGATALERARQIAADLAVAMAGKARGNSVDLATAAAVDDEVKIDVVGAAGEQLEIEMPARHMLEQIVAGFGLPGWMLGVTWSQTSGIGEQQSVVVLQESQTRFELRRAALEKPIAAMLRARGRTWKAGDWKLAQHLPNLMDEQKRAQAEFLRAQTALMLSDSGHVQLETGRGVDNNLRHLRSQRTKSRRKAGGDDDSDGEAWAEQDPALPRIEAVTSAELLEAWAQLQRTTLGLLGLSRPIGEIFNFGADALPTLLAEGARTARTMAEALGRGQRAAWERGVSNAGAQVNANFNDPIVQQAIEAQRQRMRTGYAQRGLELVRPGIGRTFQQPIVASLAAGEFDGQNPVNVASQLRARFGGGDYNWERLASSEVAMAQSDGKLRLLQQQGVTLYDYETAGDSKVSRICRDLAEAGPYRVGDASAPVPVRDSHPNCRCTIVPRA
ncbi:minor capsid protein [Pseudoxanthomonas sp. USHLN014]|uniref:minor capsid protein n=1 Tax=Pseudoxanthomonas sp. USHLN014 TaxID=3081297 RepID=UPI00301D5EBE